MLNLPPLTACVYPVPTNMTLAFIAKEDGRALTGGYVAAAGHAGGAGSGIQWLGITSSRHCVDFILPVNGGPLTTP